MGTLTKRVAAVIADANKEPYSLDPDLYDKMADAAIAEVRKADAEERAAEQASQNIAYLQANIAEMERFAARSEENDDPIGAMQWDSRAEEFQRQLDAALAVSLPTLMQPEAE